MALALGPPGVGRRSGRAASSDRSGRSDPISEGPGPSGPPAGPCRMRRAHGANAARASTSRPRYAPICVSQDTAVQHGYRLRRTTNLGPGHALDAQLPGSSRAGSSMSGLEVGPCGRNGGRMPGTGPTSSTRGRKKTARQGAGPRARGVGRTSTGPARRVRRRSDSGARHASVRCRTPRHWPPGRSPARGARSRARHATDIHPARIPGRRARPSTT